MLKYSSSYIFKNKKIIFSFQGKERPAKTKFMSAQIAVLDNFGFPQIYFSDSAQR